MERIERRALSVRQTGFGRIKDNRAVEAIAKARSRDVLRDTEFSGKKVWRQMIRRHELDRGGSQYAFACEPAAVPKHLRKPTVIPQPWIPCLRRLKARWARFDNRRKAEPGYPFISEKGPAASDRHSLGQRGGWHRERSAIPPLCREGCARRSHWKNLPRWGERNRLRPMTGVFPTVGKLPGTTLSLLPSPRHV